MQVPNYDLVAECSFCSDNYHRAVETILQPHDDHATSGKWCLSQNHFKDMLEERIVWDGRCKIILIKAEPALDKKTLDLQYTRYNEQIQFSC